MILDSNLITLLSAELIFLLVRSSDIMIVLKSTRQRSEDEQYRIERGLVRSIVIEALAFVPSCSSTGGRNDPRVLGATKPGITAALFLSCLLFLANSAMALILV